MRAPVSTSLFDQFARGWRGYLLIAALALGSAWMGAGRMPVLDIGEAAFVQGSRAMAEGANGASLGAATIGTHAAQAAAARTAKPLTKRLNAVWPYRLVSAFGLALAGAATLWGGAALIGRRPAFIGAALFAVGAMAGFLGMIATPDALGLGFATLAIAALARVRMMNARARRHALAFWTALALGVLAKGLMAPLIAALTLAALAAWERRVAWMTPLVWWPAPAFGALVLLGGYAVLQVTAFGDLLALGRVGDQFTPPGYHLFLLPFLVFPATYALPAAARLIWETARAPRGDEEHAPMRFLIAWAAPTFLLFELAPMKLPHHVIGAYPAIALICGLGLIAMRGREWRTTHPAGLVLFAVAGAGIVALTAASATFMPGDLATDLRRAVSAALIGVGVVATAIAALLMLRRPAARAGVLVVCALALSFSLRERLLPEARELHVSNEALAALTRARLTPRADRPLWIVGYSEASLDFITRAPTHFVSAEDAGARASVGDGLMVESRALQAVTIALAARDLEFVPREPPVRGLSLGRGERVALFVGDVAVSPALADGR